MKQTEFTKINNQAVERLLDTLENAPEEERPLVALLAETYIHGLIGRPKLAAIEYNRTV